MDKRRSPRRLEDVMSAARCGLNSAAAGSFRDQSWRSSGDFGLSTQNAAIPAPAIFLAPSWLQLAK
ncbi:MAG: hypothetical protein WA199_05985, partial [Xanthobacteraceae bacterium]